MAYQTLHWLDATRALDRRELRYIRRFVGTGWRYQGTVARTQSIRGRGAVTVYTHTGTIAGAGLMYVPASTAWAPAPTPPVMVQS